jgi:hypothetical protein
MGVFASIMNKIFHHGHTEAAAAEVAPPAPAPAPQTAAVQAAPAAIVQPSAAPQAVDVEAVLSEMASGKGGGGNWRTSIVDLLKLLDLDSSLGARKQLAEELNVHVGSDGTAEENIALHQAVMLKLAENGGKVPDTLKG